MSRPLKIVAYVVLVICAIGFGRGFYANYAQVNQPKPTDPQAVTNAPTVDQAGHFNSQRASKMVMYGAGVLACLIGLGLLSAHAMSHFFANRVEEFIFADATEGLKHPEYEHAEQVWADGKPLEAIQLMRDYLKEHPREQYVALRIAEIYENDLHNYLAAALEYEEILKKRLPAERWGWAAIHLSNLYSGKLNKIKDAQALLQRIVDEYGRTVAAKKARQRLGIPEPEPEPAEEAEEAAEDQSEVSPPPPVRPSNLPPGFRPKEK